MVLLAFGENCTTILKADNLSIIAYDKDIRLYLS